MAAEEEETEEEGPFAGIKKSLKQLAEKFQADSDALEDLIEFMDDEDTLDVSASGEDLKTLTIATKDLNFFRLDDIVNGFGKIVIERGTPLQPYKITITLTF